MIYIFLFCPFTKTYQDVLDPSFEFNSSLSWISECPSGFYGKNCNQQCSSNCFVTNNCNRFTGQCDKGCKLGWIGSTCDQGMLFFFMWPWYAYFFITCHLFSNTIIRYLKKMKFCPFSYRFDKYVFDTVFLTNSLIFFQSNVHTFNIMSNKKQQGYR